MIRFKTENGVRFLAIVVPIDAIIYKISDVGFLCYKKNPQDRLWNVHSGPNAAFYKKEIVGSYNLETNLLDFEVDEDWLKKVTELGQKYFVLKTDQPLKEVKTLDKKESFISILYFEINKVLYSNTEPMCELGVTLHDYTSYQNKLEKKIIPKKLLLVKHSPFRTETSSLFPIQSQIGTNF